MLRNLFIAIYSSKLITVVSFCEKAKQNFTQNSFSVIIQGLWEITSVVVYLFVFSQRSHCWAEFGNKF